MNEGKRKRMSWVAVSIASAGTIGLLLVWVVRAAAAETVITDRAAAPSAASGARPTNPINPQRAFGYLQELCTLGPRWSGSTGMQKQQALVRAHFEKLGGKVTMQPFQAKDPRGGENVRMANMFVEWHPERTERILLVAHYDTRPLPDMDPDPVKRASGIFLGANDGASGTALLMELGHLMPSLGGDIGVDFLLVDGEEFVFKKGDPYFLGATWFARKYVQEPPPHKYRWGVVLDMVADRDLQIYQERFSTSWRETRPLVREIWAKAAELGVREFIPKMEYEVQDDHIPLRNIAKIPTCDLIDFMDPVGQIPPLYWHTTADTPQQCSGSSMAKVGWVVYEWLKGQQAAKAAAAEK